MSAVPFKVAAGSLLLLASLGQPTLAEPGSASANSVDKTVTFTGDVLPILQQNCQSCHREGGDNYTGMVAPMSLTSYQEARPWAKSIARNVQSRKMPPWYADPKFHGVFENERTLSDTEIDTIVSWVNSGAPQGDPAVAPEPVEFPTNGWRIGEPDLVVDAPRYFVPDDADTHYVTHKVTLDASILPESRFVKAIEWRGGPVVHHIVGYGFLPGAGSVPGTGYGLGSIAPGEEPMEFPDGYAKLLIKDTTIAFSMHYHKEKGEGTGSWDQSQVAFKFYPKDAKLNHFVDHNAIGNRYFDIPPGHPAWKVGAGRVFEQDTSLIALHPHMHLRGRDAAYVAHYPDGTKETLLSVPAWDFNWQTDYSFNEPKRLPAGTLVEYTAFFDNSEANPANPDPTVSIDWGPETWDEMMLGYVTYSHTEAKQLTVKQVLADHFGVSSDGFEEEVSEEEAAAVSAGAASGSDE